jgi:LDH2 family malate/lactate/ureidoglycolate dehydrogenase
MTIGVVSTEERDLRKFAIAIQQLAAGRSNATGTVTLTESATTTAVTDANFAAGSTVMLTPTTSNAAAALGTTYVSARANGSFTLTHANNSQTDRTFLYAIQG